MLARQLRALPGLEGCRLVAVTGLSSSQSQVGGRAAGVELERCLTEPVDLHTLFEAIEDEAIARPIAGFG